MHIDNDSTSVTVKITHHFNRDQIEVLLIGAFEGGSNYWIKEVEPVKEGEDVYEAPFGLGLKVTDLEGQTNYLNHSAFHRGLQTMADTYPRHMGDIISKNDDATTADVFLQCCLFGQLVYG